MSIHILSLFIIRENRVFKFSLITNWALPMFSTSFPYQQSVWTGTFGVKTGPKSFLKHMKSCRFYFPQKTNCRCISVQNSFWRWLPCLTLLQTGYRGIFNHISLTTLQHKSGLPIVLWMHFSASVRAVSHFLAVFSTSQTSVPPFWKRFDWVLADSGKASGKPRC